MLQAAELAASPQPHATATSAGEAALGSQPQADVVSDGEQQHVAAHNGQVDAEQAHQASREPTPESLGDVRAASQEAGQLQVR